MVEVNTMRAVEISAPGGPEVLRETRRPMPIARAGEVVIRLAYAGVNRPDALQRAGLYNPPATASDLPGLEGAGEVVALGAGVTSVALGDSVCALLPGGGYAEYATCPAAHCLPVPAGLTLKQAACLPETFFTVWSNVFLRGGLKAGERFLVHGGSSGIGTVAIQLAKARGARVFTTAGSAEKCAACTALGAERAMNYREVDFAKEMREIGGADVILDMVGGDYLQRNINALADDGRLVQIAFLQGFKQEVNFMQIMTRRLTLTGSTLRPQSDLAKARFAEDLRAEVWPLLASGAIFPVMDEEFELSDAAKAHTRMEASQHIGKIVLKVS
ncbi:NAD(P)H-quinone oxidoreductase [Falsihalocynthiibacter arcticus]|uniref:NAD(P)H-quinone oxidoreductase n=1 Tax=Falsihalocynthiibacter arcticus TaxID=1579316 RepID=A0A126V0U0_9RHOB|nr:NAD(P)H-quinone oxidoreductase [Falsihalocynthiibacter arcticus]AML51299.1 NAD(P)H-quinone oxidoreductase [Falsihalocynthiibacter arcticus]